MYEVRSYDQVLHPDLFKGGGVLGLTIRALNFVRWKLEVLVQYLVILYGLRVENFSPAVRKKVLEGFWYDVEREKLAHTETSPLRAFDLPKPADSDMSAKDEGTAVVTTDDKPGEDIMELVKLFGPRKRGQRLNRTRYVPHDILLESEADSEEPANGNEH